MAKKIDWGAVLEALHDGHAEIAVSLDFGMGMMSITEIGDLELMQHDKAAFHARMLHTTKGNYLNWLEFENQNFQCRGITKKGKQCGISEFCYPTERDTLLPFVAGKSDRCRRHKN